MHTYNSSKQQTTFVQQQNIIPVFTKYLAISPNLDDDVTTSIWVNSNMTWLWQLKIKECVKKTIETQNYIQSGLL